MGFPQSTSLLPASWPTRPPPSSSKQLRAVRDQPGDPWKLVKDAGARGGPFDLAKAAPALSSSFAGVYLRKSFNTLAYQQPGR